MPDDVERIVFCSGKVFYDLADARKRRRRGTTRRAIIRVEQFYPFPQKALTETIARYPKRERAWSGVRKSRRTWAAGPSWSRVLENLMARCDRPALRRARGIAESGHGKLCRACSGAGAIRSARRAD